MNTKSVWASSLIGVSTTGSEKVRALKVSNDGKFVFAGTDSSFICLDAGTGKELRRHGAVHKGAITKMATSSFNNWIATFGQDNKAIVWEGSDIQPYKRFTLGTKSPPYEMCFNRNETTLYIMAARELICIALKGEATEKEIKRITLGDKDTVSGCLVEKLGILILADTSNNLLAVDLDRFEKVTLCQKLSTVNTMRFFDNDDTLWVAFSNNLIGVYELMESGLINFNALERRAPFEVLAIERVSDELVAVSGFHNQVALLSSTGHSVTTLMTVQSAVILRHFCVQQNQLYLGTESQVECFDLSSAHDETFLGDYSIKINDLCTVEISKSGVKTCVSDRKNTNFKLNGLIRSIHFCRESYLAILFGEGGSSRVQLVDWKMIEKSLVDPAEEEDSDDKFDVVFNRFADKFGMGDDNPSGILAGVPDLDGRNLFDCEVSPRDRLGLRKNGEDSKDFANKKGKNRDIFGKSNSKIKILKGEDWLADVKKIYVGGSNLYFVLPQKILQTDFSLRILHIWSQNAPIVTTEFLENTKRKEIIYVALKTGEINRISADNSFPVLMIDHKVAPISVQVSTGRDQIMVLDQNKNLTIYALNTPQNTKSVVSMGGIVQAGFSRSATGLYYTLDEEGALTVAYQGATVVQKNIIEKLERIAEFKQSELTVLNPTTQTVRSVELNLGQIYSKLIRDKKTKEAFDLMTLVGASQTDFKKLGISALRTGVTEPFVIQSFQVAGNTQLLQLAREHYNCITSSQAQMPNSSQVMSAADPAQHTTENAQKSLNSTLTKTNSTLEKGLEAVIQANSVREDQFRLHAEMLAAEGKINQAVDMLLKEKQPALAIEILVTLGKYEQAVKVLRNPMYSGNASLAKFDLSKIIKLQGEEALRKNDVPKAIEFFIIVKDFAKVVDLLVRKDKAQDLISLVRDQTLASLGKPTLIKAAEYFQAKNHLPYAKECLIKAEEDELMVDLLVEFECYEEALDLARRISQRNPKNNFLEKVYLPYANLLLSENKFEEALDIYLKMKDLSFCEGLLRKMIFVNVYFRNFELVSQLYFFASKIQKMKQRGQTVDSQTLLKGGDGIDLPQESIFYQALASLERYERDITYREYCTEFGMEPTNLTYSLGCLILVLNILKVNPKIKYPGNLVQALEKAVEMAWELDKSGTLKFLVEKLAVVDPNHSSVSKFAFLCQLAGDTKNEDRNDVFFECVNCDARGFETNGLHCPECNIRLTFCPVSGKHIRVVRVTLSEALQSEREGNLNWYQSFNIKFDQTNRTKWSQSDDDEFLTYLRDNLANNLVEGSFRVNSVRTQGLMSLKRTINFQGADYLYWGRNSCNDAIVYCRKCRMVVDAQAFEQICDRKRCLSCTAGDFKSAVNC